MVLLILTEHYCLWVPTSLHGGRLGKIWRLQTRCPSRSKPCVSECSLQIWTHNDTTRYLSSWWVLSLQRNTHGLPCSSSLFYLVGLQC